MGLRPLPAQPIVIGSEGGRKTKKEMLPHTVPHLVEPGRSAQIQQLLKRFVAWAPVPLKPELPGMLVGPLPKDIALADANESLQATQQRIERLLLAEDRHPLSDLSGIEREGRFATHRLATDALLI